MEKLNENITKASKAFDKAVEVANIIKDSFAKSIALKDIAAEMAKTGLIDKALNIFNQAIEMANIIDECANWRSSALKDISEALAKAGLTNRAIEVANTIEGSSVKSVALRSIIDILIKIGRRYKNE